MIPITKNTVLFILLINYKINNDNLFNMMQMVSKQTEGRFNIVPIAHSKYLDLGVSFGVPGVFPKSDDS